MKGNHIFTMNVKDCIETFGLEIAAAKSSLDRQIQNAYCGDLLSDVMANGRKDGLWTTIQVHPNIIAVAVLKELAAVVLASGRRPTEETVERAEKENVPLLGTTLTAFEFVGRLYERGIKGS